MDLKSKLSKENISRARKQMVEPAEALTEDNSNDVLDRTTDFLLEHEGYSPTAYKDHNSVGTIGVGSNLTSPATQKAAEELKLNTEQLRAPGGVLSPEQSKMLTRKTLEVKYPEYQTIKGRDFPNASLNSEQEAALMSMYYNNPKLIGPMMRGYLDSNDIDKTAQEIMLRSNANKVPGIAKRRLAEAEKFAGERFPEVMKAIPSESKKELLTLLESIENPNEKIRVLEKYKQYLQ